MSIIRGTNVTVTVQFKVSGVLVDPVTINWFKIYNPSGVAVATVITTRLSVGVHRATYTVPATAVIGLWSLRWSWIGTSGMATLVQSQSFSVVKRQAVHTYLAQMLPDIAVYWGNPIMGGQGNYTYNDPIEIRCRWENKTELFVDAHGVEQKSVAVIYTDQELDNEGQLMLGDLIDLDSDEQPPTDTERAYRIRKTLVNHQILGQIKVVKIWL